MSHCSIENTLLFTLRMYKNVFKYNINAFFFACMHACMWKCLYALCSVGERNCSRYILYEKYIL